MRNHACRRDHHGDAQAPGQLSVPDDDARLALCTARAGLVSHGLALAHTHVRLNSTQIHNAVRQRLGIADAPDADPLDLLCHLAFNGPLRTRRERAQRVAAAPTDFFDQYGPEARSILDELLDKYELTEWLAGQRLITGTPDDIAGSLDLTSSCPSRMTSPPREIA